MQSSLRVITCGLWMLFSTFIGGCAIFSDPQYYSVSIVNHTDRAIMNGYIRLGKHEQWAGGGVSPGEGGGGGVSLDVRRLTHKATFWWDWADDGDEPPLRVELPLPASSETPEDSEIWLYKLLLHVHSDNRVRAELITKYYDSSDQYRALRSLASFSEPGHQEQSVNPSDWE